MSRVQSSFGMLMQQKADLECERDECIDIIRDFIRENRDSPVSEKAREFLNAMGKMTPNELSSSELHELEEYLDGTS